MWREEEFLPRRGPRACLFCEWRWGCLRWHSFHDVLLPSPPQPILPYHMHRFSSLSPYQRELLEKTRSYIRMFCAVLSGFIFVLLLCLSPLHWVKFKVLKDKKTFFAGLWTVCHHDLCWSHVPKAPCECLPNPRAPPPLVDLLRSSTAHLSPFLLPTTSFSSPIHKHLRTTPPNRVNWPGFVLTRLPQWPKNHNSLIIGS